MKAIVLNRLFLSYDSYLQSCVRIKHSNVLSETYLLIDEVFSVFFLTLF